MKFLHIRTFSFHNGLTSTYGSSVPFWSSPLPCYVLRFVINVIIIIVIIVIIIIIIIIIVIIVIVIVVIVIIIAFDEVERKPNFVA